ncbi:multidrug transporter [Vibrio inusitatus NBRC 102082]|uniref:Multidrug transporter n=1 Tax=Vibrio inusitatus NBRC 102082 TaxID=1219070 RepID=A0A4Y3HVN8_9VIBR|nr:EamA family transporter [Vibrio inusitatus]GEA50812.1 multidrug transporter [Vibrio inusitatus NBRC 102082]
MSIIAVVLVVFSALLHAGWNVLGKSGSGSGYSFALVASLTPFILLSPYLVWCIHVIGITNINCDFIGLLVFSCIGQAIYLVSVIKAYEHGDVGMMYPIVRALPVLMVGLGTLMIGQAISVNAWVGFVILTMGCLLVPLTTLRDLKLSAYANIGVLWAVIAAMGTTLYSILDKEALNWLVLETSGLSSQHIAIFYLGMQFFGISTVLLCWLLLTNNHSEIVNAKRHWKGSSIAGVMMGLTYGIVLYAMTLVDNVSYIVALRQVSIVFGLALGIAILNERWYLLRGIGVSLVLIGLVVALV